MSRPRKTASLIAAILLCGPAALQACSCLAAAPACQAAPESEAVFLGRAVRVQQNVIARKNNFTFLVAENFKGAGKRQIEIATGVGGGDCGIWFEVGRDYLVYAYRDSDGSLSTGVCMRTAPAAAAAADLAYLRNLPKDGASSRIYGFVTQLGALVDEFSLQRAEQAPHPLANVVVRAESGVIKRQTITDPRGNYTLDLLPAGSYKVSAAIPARLGGVAEKTIVVKDHACSVQRFAAARHLDPITPGGYRLEVYSSRKDAPGHLIAKNATFKYLDGGLGQIEQGDLKVKIVLVGPPPGKGQRLEVNWLIDGKIVDGRLVNPNTIDELNAPPIRGSYKVELRLDGELAADYRFRVN